MNLKTWNIHSLSDNPYIFIYRSRSSSFILSLACFFFNIAYCQLFIQIYIYIYSRCIKCSFLFTVKVNIYSFVFIYIIVAWSKKVSKTKPVGCHFLGDLWFSPNFHHLLFSKLFSEKILIFFSEFKKLFFSPFLISTGRTSSLNLFETYFFNLITFSRHLNPQLKNQLATLHRLGSSTVITVTLWIDYKIKS